MSILGIGRSQLKTQDSPLDGDYIKQQIKELKIQHLVKDYNKY